jgi:thimet oligopeptidase
MKRTLLFILVAGMFACTTTHQPEVSDNPVFNTFNEPIDFAAINADHLIEATAETKATAESMLNDLIAIPDADKTFDNTMRALDDAYNKVSSVATITQLLGAVHPDSLVRATAQEKNTELSQYYNEISLNEDLYKAVKSYSETEEARALDSWKARFINKEVADFERNGFALSKEDRDKLKAIKDEFSVISEEWDNNLSSYEDYMHLTEEEMGGLSDDYKKVRLQEDGTYKIGVSYPDIQPFFRNSSNDAARKELLRMYTNRAADTNLEVLIRMISKRDEMAQLLGFENFAEYTLSDKMARDPDQVKAFLLELKDMATPKAYADIAEMVGFQRDKMGIDRDVVDPWSRSYVINKMRIQEYGVDIEEIREYFPLESAIDGLFSITQNLFDLEYKLMPDASVWHEDVSAYEVFDDGKLIGRFYLDLHPRPNKYNHAACFPVIIGKSTPAEYQIPTYSLVCNFTVPTEDKPALLTHDEVETLFHEFGHVLHGLLTKAELSAQSGFGVSWDFVEAPSQIFENWIWNYEALSLFAKHYETGEVLPRELFDKMLAAKTLMSGRNTLYQVFLSTLDMTYYGGFDPEDEDAIIDMQMRLDKEINLLDPFPPNRMSANFGHLNDYAGSYYGYLWSKVFAQDMFSRFEEEGIFSKDAGLDYKNYILAQGAMKDEMEMLREFLGREPNKEAFIRSLGL